MLRLKLIWNRNCPGTNANSHFSLELSKKAISNSTFCSKRLYPKKTLSDRSILTFPLTSLAFLSLTRWNGATHGPFLDPKRENTNLCSSQIFIRSLWLVSTQHPSKRDWGRVTELWEHTDLFKCLVRNGGYSYLIWLKCLLFGTNAPLINSFITL